MKQHKDYGIGILTAAQKRRYEARQAESDCLAGYASAEESKAIRRIIEGDSSRFRIMATKLYWSAQRKYHQEQAAMAVRAGFATCIDCQQPYIISPGVYYTYFSCPDISCGVMIKVADSELPEDIKRKVEKVKAITNG